jgi:cellulose synthase/poly-beta-1,6-N-acetylglucosamine synthase-like glycosyltransferase
VILISIIFIAYTILIGGLILGNFRLVHSEITNSPKTKVSIIIAFKDEERNLEKLLRCLMSQDYSSDLLELIFVNDHSIDNGEEKLKLLSKSSPFLVKNLNLDKGEGKKKAIDFGIESSNGEFIITTDADCFMNPKWVLSLVSEFESTKASFIAGPVGLTSNNSFVENVLQLEFSALIASTSGGFGTNRPIMCNGANLGFTRKVYDELKPYESNAKQASGDDVFFLHQVKKNGLVMGFVNSRDALVSTKGSNRIIEFINQRIRWAGKSKAYRDIDTILVGLIVTLTNLVLLLSFFCFLIWELSFVNLSGLFLFKSILDIALIYSAKNWTLTKNIILNSLLLSFIYPFYSVGIALLSLAYKPKWKGRKI